MSTDPGTHAAAATLDLCEPHAGQPAGQDTFTFSPVRVKRYRNNPLGPGRASVGDLIDATSTLDHAVEERPLGERSPSPRLPLYSQSLDVSATPKSSSASGSWSVVATVQPCATLDRPNPSPNLCRHLTGRFALELGLRLPRFLA